MSRSVSEVVPKQGLCKDCRLECAGFIPKDPSIVPLKQYVEEKKEGKCGRCAARVGGVCPGCAERMENFKPKRENRGIFFCEKCGFRTNDLFEKHDCKPIAKHDTKVESLPPKHTEDKECNPKLRGELDVVDGRCKAHHDSCHAPKSTEDGDCRNCALGPGDCLDYSYFGKLTQCPEFVKPKQEQKKPLKHCGTCGNEFCAYPGDRCECWMGNPKQEEDGEDRCH